MEVIYYIGAEPDAGVANLFFIMYNRYDAPIMFGAIDTNQLNKLS